MKWTIEMSSKELARKTEVERVLDQRITQKAAARKLEISERQFRRVLRHNPRHVCHPRQSPGLRAGWCANRPDRAARAWLRRTWIGLLCRTEIGRAHV